MPPRPRVTVCLEAGRRRVFASALDWPGWCRSGRDEAEALDVLAAYTERYAPVARRAALTPPSPLATLAVSERLAGGASTDFGAPGAVAASERRAHPVAAAQRLTRLLAACWATLDTVGAAAPAALRKGPRGGGRDRDAIVAHVVEAERAYARKLGVRLDARQWREGGPALLREHLLTTLEGSWRPTPADAPGWPPAYLVRRTAWHALDHAWEIEDRS